MCFGRSHVLGFQAIFIFFHCFPVPCTCSAEPLLATAGVWTVQEVQFFSVIGDGSIVPAAESALQRFIHAFLCCPARGRERGEWVTHPSAHWLVLWKCVRNDLSHLGLSLSISYIQANAQMLVQSARERVCSFKATAWEGRDPETHTQHTHVHTWMCNTARFPQTVMCDTHMHPDIWGRFIYSNMHKHFILFDSSPNGEIYLKY